MKLSEAIRLGALLKPQGFGMGSIGYAETCAIGAAFDACGIRGDVGFWATTAYRTWPVLGTKLDDGDLLDKILDLNDVQRVAREDIADWVATIEAHQDATVIETPEPVRA